MNGIAAAIVVIGLLAVSSVQAQERQTSDVPLKTTFVRLINNANAIVVEPVTPDPVRRRIAMLYTHPERINNFNHFLGEELPKRGYPTMLMNYYGPEVTYEEFLAPIAAAVTHLRSLPGVEKVVFAGFGTGGVEMGSYQDVAENGPKACQGPERIYPCRGENLTDLPKADGMMALNLHIGGPFRTIALDPAVDNARPRERNPDLDMYSARNGFDAETKVGTYTAEFTKGYLAAQGARNNRLVDEAVARLAKIEKGDGDYKDDEPFVVVGGSIETVGGARLDYADRRFLSRTRTPHTLLTADGSTVTQVVTSIAPPRSNIEILNRLYTTANNVTVRKFLSFLSLRTTADYAVTEDGIAGIVWRSSANSGPGNMEGITVPTLVVGSTCGEHLVTSEISYDHSAAKDKQFVAIDGALAGFRPCKPEYGDTMTRTFDYVDGWLTTPGRF